MSDSLQARFLRFVEPITDSRGCWEWNGARDNKGYGHLGDGSRVIRAHRVSWLLHFGEIPARLHVLHRCDNPSCVNPRHLFLGTNLDNVKDKVLKGRSVNVNGSARKTVCDAGHPLAGDNLALIPSKRARCGYARRCKECNKLRSREYRARQASKR